MAVPKKKQAKSSTSRRHSTWVSLNRTRLVRQTHIVKCASCDEPKLSHTICPSCGLAGSKIKDVVNPAEAAA
jgi:ribosomal protein L32